MNQTRTSKHQPLFTGVAGLVVLALGAPIAFAFAFGLMTGWIISVAACALVGDGASPAGSPWQAVGAGDWWAVDSGA